MDECESVLRDPLVQAFGEQLDFEQIEGDCRVILPFARSDGDRITLYVREQFGGYVITDEGETAAMLFSSGVNIKTDRRIKRVEAAKERFGLHEAVDKIELRATSERLGERILDAFQAVQWISMLEYTRTPQSMVNFRTQVAAFLDEEGWSFETKYEVEAQSETQTVDFAISDLENPTFMDSIHANNAADLERKCRHTAYKWLRIRPIQSSANLISVVDDVQGTFEPDRISPIETDSDAVVQWSNRDALSTAIEG